MPPTNPQSPQDIVPPSKPISAGANPPHYKNILCVEDEHFIGELYTRALSKAGYQVKVVIDGLAGLQEAQKDIYDIILLDIMVPTMTGIEILKQLRAKNPTLKAKVIITTNLEQSEEARAAIEKQADAYIVKADVTPRQLVEMLQSLETT